MTAKRQSKTNFIACECTVYLSWISKKGMPSIYKQGFVNIDSGSAMAEKVF